MSNHVATYMESFDKFRTRICVPKAEAMFDQYLLAYRGQGYWIPELNDDVDVESIKALLPQFEKKVAWIKDQKGKVKALKKLPNEDVTASSRRLLKKLLALKKGELASDEAKRTATRKESLKVLGELLKSYETLIKKVSFLSNFQYPVDHLKNRKVYDEYREKEDTESVKIANYSFLYRKLLEDGAYNKDRTGSDIYLRTTIDTLHFELQEHGFYLSEDARYDMEFVLSKIESELAKGKSRIVERLDEWEDRTRRALDFYRSLTLPENQVQSIAGDKNSTPNRQLILQHNRASDQLKEFVYTKQAEVYNYWLNQPELPRAIFVLETILLNEVGGVDGDDALERQDVARVVMNRLDKPKYLSIGKKEFIYPYLKKVTTDFHIKNERWLNALFKQGEFSFTYYYMSGVAKIFCPDMAPRAKKLRQQNVEIALQVLKEGDTSFKTTRYFSRASMIGRIHMDSIWEDYIPYPERPGLLAKGQEELLKAFNDGDYTFLYSFKDPAFEVYQVVEIKGRNYALGEKNGIKLFYDHRNPHYFRYFTKTETGSR
ncbi:hypothetical protein [Peredibacter starrii]|uniref:Uncharacterized protein n=1 Tax=Peredibacter starrii TaxID=28202 RepID=A0AAX4HNM2_9BACT|nr:hypothetical protein [Peredibacter starrii]WPU64933.1 hypothetical protein SOO65_19750 [Peredibacter starrii]